MRAIRSNRDVGKGERHPAALMVWEEKGMFGKIRLGAIGIILLSGFLGSARQYFRVSARSSQFGGADLNGPPRPSAHAKNRPQDERPPN